VVNTSPVEMYITSLSDEIPLTTNLSNNKNLTMKIALAAGVSLAFLFMHLHTHAQSKTNNAAPKYDTIIRLRADKPVKKQAVKSTEIVLPVPEYINQPYYYDRNENKLIRLENAIAQMIIKKKTFGLKGAKQVLNMNEPSSKIRFTAKKDIVFFIKTSGDVIDLTSYIKLYQFIPADQKREVTISAREGMLNDNEDEKGKQISFSVKLISKDNYMIQLPEALEAGEYGFVWMKNMELKEFGVHAFAINWKSSD
jgi:hypothetical protein